MARQEFHSTPVKRFRPVEVRSAYRFLRNLQQKPDDLMDNLR